MLDAGFSQVSKTMAYGNTFTKATQKKLALRPTMHKASGELRKYSLECVFMGTINRSWTRHGDYDLLEMGNVGKMAP